MKRTYLLTGLFLMTLVSFSMTSCSTEETAAQEAARTSKVEKTPEMVKFETALKAWVKYKAENSGNAKSTELAKEREAIISKEAEAFLTSEGYSTNDIKNKTANNSAQLISMALHAYAEKTKTKTN
jgi:hypothetical protein